MTDRTINQTINVPDDCDYRSMVYPKKHLANYPHFRVFNEGITKLVLDNQLKAKDKEVFLYLLGIMDYENFIDISQKDLAEGIGMQQQNISRSIKKLVKFDYLRVIGKAGRQNIYKVNPAIALKGRGKNYAGMLQDWNYEGEDTQAS